MGSVDNGVKLTLPQIDFLRRSATARGAYASHPTRTVVALLAAGFVNDGNDGKGSKFTTVWFITEAGTKWLAEHDKK